MRSPTRTGVGQSRVESTRQAVWRPCCSVWAAAGGSAEPVLPVPPRPSLRAADDRRWLRSRRLQGGVLAGAVSLERQKEEARRAEKKQVQAQAREALDSPSMDMYFDETQLRPADPG